jgi:membrane-associated phospholipid phosphatase
MLRMLLRVRAVDALMLVFVLFLISLSIAYKDRLPDAGALVSVYFALLAGQALVASVKGKGGFFRLLYDLIYPVIYVVVIFDSLGNLVHYVNPRDIDPLLIRLDYKLFGGYPTVMFEALVTPLLTEVFQIAYTTYYFIPVVFGVVLKLRGREEEFQRSLFLLVLCFFLSYLGYIFMPALGPRYTISHLHSTELTGLFLATPIERLLNSLEGIKRDAFPSGHTAVALLVLVLSLRYERVLFWIFLLPVAALILSTVYCRYHYAVDIFAGMGLTIITVFIGDRCYDCWQKRQSADSRGRKENI